MIVSTLTPQATPSPWRNATRVAFRFCFVYFGAFVLTTQMLGDLIAWSVDWPGLAAVPPLRPLVVFVGRHVFRIRRELVITGSGSGDKTFDWLLVFTLLVIAIVTTGVWSILDRRRSEYSGLHRWFRVFLRFALGSTMLSYGLAKALPAQMPPSLVRLVEPFGSFSPMGVLWASIGASLPYEIVIGCAEVASGLLLFVPRTALLGAIMSLLDATFIFTLNMTYDVPVKLFSFHLMLLSLVLIAPDAPALADFFLLNRSARRRLEPPLVAGRWRRVAVAGQGLFAAYLVTVHVYGGVQDFRQWGAGAPKSPLFGIWNVEEMAIDGEARAPLLTDGARWRRVIFQVPARATFQRVDDTMTSYNAAIDATATRMSLTRASDPKSSAAFSVARVGGGQLVLDGAMDGHRTRMRLRLADARTFVLTAGGFHWVQEYPFNR